MTRLGRRLLLGVEGSSVLLLAAFAACSHQDRYAPPEGGLHCPQRVICSGNGGWLDHSGETCRCGKLVDHID